LNVFFVTPGLVALTSVGDGTASSRANRDSSERRRGTRVNRAPGNRVKYGRPYAMKVKTPCGANEYACSTRSRAASSWSWSSPVGADDSRAGAKSV
jgi:hypothetical protein